MPSQDKPAGNSPFEIITPGKSKKIGKTGIIVGVSIVIFLILSVVAGVFLVRQQQNIQEKAAGNCDNPASIVQCPRSDGNLVSCTPPDANNNAQISICNLAGRIEGCGGAQYCCPTAGAAWTTNMSACAVATSTPTVAPTSTPTATPTATPTGVPTPTATSSGSGNSCNGTCGSNSNCQTGLYCYSGFCRNPLCASDSACGCSAATATPTGTAAATQTAQTTPLPIPVTGTDWPTFLGVGVGIGAILISLLLAL